MTTPFGRRCEAVPAGCGPGRVGFFPTRWGRDVAVLERSSEFVTNAVKWRDDLVREAAGFGQHQIDGLLIEITIKALRERGF